MLKRTLSPWNNGPASPSAATNSNSEVTTYTYASLTSVASGSGQGIELTGRVTTRPSSGSAVTTGKWETYTSSVDVQDLIDLLEDAEVDADWLPDASSIREESSRRAASASEWLVSYSFGYKSVEVAGSPWVGSTFASLDSSGDGTVTGYELGAYNGSTEVFTVNGSTDTGTDIRTTAVKVAGFGAPAINEATKTVSISDRLGKSLRRELWIKDGSGWHLATTTTWEYPQVWADGSARETIEKHDGRIVSHDLQVSDMETVSSDEQGITTTTVTDALGRTVSMTKEGVSAGTGYDAQPAVVTTYTYSGHATTVTTAAGGLSTSTSSTTDLAGRAISETDASGITRTTNHDRVDGRPTTTVTGPGGTTTQSSSSIDGNNRSQSGDAIVDSSSTVEVLSNGNLLTTTRTGDVVDSPRYHATEVDWAGRTVSTRQPAPEEGGPHDEIMYSTTYQSGTNRVKSQQSLAGTMLTEYPSSSSSLTRTGYSKTLSSTLNVATDVFVTEHLSTYAYEGGFWWEVSTNRQFDVEDSSTSTLTSVTKRCLCGVPGTGLASKAVRIDPTGATYTMVSQINRSSRTRTTTTSWNGSTNSGVEVNVNGLAVSSLGHEGGSPTTWSYDALGRRTRETNPRGAVTRTIYNAQGLVGNTIDAYGKLTRYEYIRPPTWRLEESRASSVRMPPTPRISMTNLAMSPKWRAMPTTGSATSTTISERSGKCTPTERLEQPTRPSGTTTTRRVRLPARRMQVGWRRPTTMTPAEDCSRIHPPGTIGIIRRTD